ncbi:hypothetical protein [Coleofasciculus sp. FACHB-1120]|nr:hypothetical protein [Coleofasciculus sp. FACHB-1120]
MKSAILQESPVGASQGNGSAQSLVGHSLRCPDACQSSRQAQ